MQARPKPSLGGMPIHEPNPWLDHLTGRSASPFGSHAAAPHNPPFGQQQPQQPAPQAVPFGAGAGPSMLFGIGGQAAKPAPAFGPGAQHSGQAGALGGGFGATAAAFGQPAAPFGQPLAAPGTGLLFGQPAAPPPAAAPAMLFGQLAQPVPPAAPATLFGQPAQASPQAAPATLFGQPVQPLTAPGFGRPQQRQQQQPAMPFGAPAASMPEGFGAGGGFMTQSGLGAPTAPQGLFGSGAAPTPSTPRVQAAEAAEVKSDVMTQFMAPVFTRGQIPDTPPPPQLCV